MRRIQFVPKTVVCDATNNTVPTTAPTAALNGYLRGVKIKTPATVDGSATVAVTIKDADGDTIYTKSGVAVATVNQDYFDTKANANPLEQPVAGTYTISATFSANQTPVRNVIVTLLMDQLF